MYIEISEELRTLADIFERNKEDLYIVGGCVRDAILGIKSTQKNDIDLCSSCKPEKLIKMLKKAGIEYDDKFSSLGTVVILGEKRYEHTTFRSENYGLNGKHSPDHIEFIKDIKQDALRRDFTVNAIYYHISSGNIVDPLEGQADVKNRLLKTCNNAYTSFHEDSERILRLIRFACCLNFDIEENTLAAAVESSVCVANLSKHRIRKEFEKILTCDLIYPTVSGTEFAHARSLILIGTFNLWKYVLPAVDNLSTCGLKDDKGEDLYEHAIRTVSICNAEVRLACLLHDVGKIYTKIQRKNFEFSQDWASVIIQENLGVDGLGYSNKEVYKIQRVIKALDWDRRGIEPKRKVREFIRENFDIFSEICMVKDAIAFENTNFTQKSRIAGRWMKIYKLMIENRTPIYVSDLSIDGNDIIDKLPNIKLKKIGELLNYLLDFCLNHPFCNEKEILLQKVLKLVKKSPNLYLE